MVNMKNSIFVRYRRFGGLGRESGVALIIALICLFVMSTLAVGVLYSTQSEIWTTANYRAVTQARYIAEAGAQQALNYLQTQNPITSSSGFTSTNFNLNAMPITYVATGKTLVMSTSGISPKYLDTYGAMDATTDTAFTTTYFPASITQTPFASMATGCSGSGCPKFDVAVQLLTAIPKGGGNWLTRWKIVSEGTVNTIGSSSSGQGKAMVQVVEVVDNVMVETNSSSSSPTYTAGVFTTGTGCDSIRMSGGQYTNSYVGATQVGVTNPTLSNTGGNIGTFGNVHITNGAYIIGNVFSPFYNAGTNGTYGISGGPLGLNGSAICNRASGGTEYAVNEDNSGSGVGCTSMSAGSCSQHTSNLPSPPPSYPTPIMPTVATNTAACTGFNGLCNGGSGGGSGCAITIPPSGVSPSPANFGAVNFGSCAVVTLQAGTYNMDSLLISNGATVVLPSTGSVVINILDNGSTTMPLNINGGTVANNGGNPANLTFVYAGTKTINLAAGANMFGTVYAPNAPAAVSGNAGLYGAVVSSTATFSGSGHVIYDSSLNGTGINVNTSNPPTANPGPLHVDEFSWSAF